MDKNALRYPLGIQTFPKIIEGGYVYVDKTEYVYNMTRYKYIYLSRPRRFGKSLLVSTLKSYFEGRQDLFKGLAIEKLEEEWIEYPVIHLDMSGGRYFTEDSLERYLLSELADNARRLKVAIDAEYANIGLIELIQGAYEKYGNKVVLLIDACDAPLLDVMHEKEKFRRLNRVMQNLYAPIKDCDRYLRFVFLTGITKYSSGSIFSGFNNLYDISMNEEFAGICGITEEEMLTQLGAGIDALADEQGLTKDEAIQALKDNYGGHHLTWPSPEVFNPNSLLNALEDKSLEPHWLASCLPSYLIEMIHKCHATPSEVCSCQEAVASTFYKDIEGIYGTLPLLYQSGYKTIKGCVPRVKLYTLDVPNREVLFGLLQYLKPYYLGMRHDKGSVAAVYMRRALLQDDIDHMFKVLQDFLENNFLWDEENVVENWEMHWQQMLYVIFSLLGATCDVEVHTPKGRVDLVAQTANKLYLIEVKLNQSAEAAMKQIDLKDYAARFSLSTLPVVKVEANFDQEKRNITDWRMKES